MAKWVKVQISSGEQLILASEIVSIKRTGRNVTLVTKHNGIFTWDWEGTSAEWSTFVGGLELDNAV